MDTQSHINSTRKIGNDVHNDTVTGKEAGIILSDCKLNGGRFIIDAISVKVLNLTDFTLYGEFTGHLAPDNSISSGKSTEAFLDITSVMGNHVAGDLNIKGILHPIDFDVVVNMNDDVLTVTAKLVVDRTKIRYEIPLV